MWMRIRSALRNLLDRRQIESELDSEIRSYVDAIVDEKVAEGLSPEEARRRALAESGGMEQIKQAVRDVRAGSRMELVFQDLRYATRQLIRNPVYAWTVIITLAACIGANTAVFSCVNALLLRPLPYAKAERLFYVSEFWPHEPVLHRVPSPDYAIWRAQGKSFDQLQAYASGVAYNLTGDGEPERVDGVPVSAGFLELLGIHPLLGRSFQPDEDRPGAPLVTVIGHALWARHFGSSSEAIGKAIRLNGKPYTVVGVLPASFIFPDNDIRAELLIPLALPANPNWHDPNAFRLLRVLTRLKSGMQREAAQAELLGLARSTAAIEPPQFVNMRRDMQVTVTGLRDRLSGDVRARLLILEAAVLVALMIGCLNVANLQIGNAVARHQEMVTRVALGASPFRVSSQLLLKSILLSGLGGAAGLGLGYWGLQILRHLLPADLQLLQIVRIDRAVLLFTGGVAVLTGIVTGLAPIGTLMNMGGKIRDTTFRTTAPQSQQRARSALVIAEIAVAMILLFSAALVIRTFVKSVTIDPGFEPRSVLTVRIPLTATKYRTPYDQAAFFSQLLDLARALPGVRMAALGETVPAFGAGTFVGTAVEGRPFPAPGAAPDISYTPISSEYFQTLHMPLLGGRLFGPQDQHDAPQVAIINQAFANTFFEGQDAVGRHIKTSAMTGPWREIVGVVADIRNPNLLEPEVPQIYVPFVQDPAPEMFLMLRTSVPPAGLVPQVVRSVRKLDPDQTVYNVATMDERLSNYLATPRSNLVLMGVLAALALFLAAIGIYGVLSSFAGSRSREIAIRMALGAQQWDVVKPVMEYGGVLTAIGMGVGLPGALLGARALRTLLYGLSPSDPVALSGVCVLFALLAMTACYIPARNASKADPIARLRQE